MFLFASIVTESGFTLPEASPLQKMSIKKHTHGKKITVLVTIQKMQKYLSSQRGKSELPRELRVVP